MTWPVSHRSLRGRVSTGQDARSARAASLWEVELLCCGSKVPVLFIDVVRVVEAHVCPGT